MTHHRSHVEAELPEFLGGSVEVGTVAPARRAAERSEAHVSGEAGSWIFQLGDITIFAAIMPVFLWDRRADVDGFEAAAHQLIQPIGAVNTLVLLLSPYLVVRALVAHRAARYTVARRSLAAAMGCAALFAGLKAIEYYTEISTGHTPASGQFFTFHFVFTGLHLLHVLVGTGLLAAWRWTCGRADARGTPFIEPWRVSCYWHMVDLLWVAIFVVVYLVSAEWVEPCPAGSSR